MQIPSATAELRSAYEGLESNFPDLAARDSYRAAMLARSAEQAGFLAPLLAPRASVLEVGCGNGRLLIELARRGALSAGLGIDIAHSRVEFARRWAADVGLDVLDFQVADALTMELEANSYDAIICITGAFGYFEPVAAGTAAALMQRWAVALRQGGIVVLELYPHPSLVRMLRAGDGTVRLWQELDAGDPWRFYLSELQLQDGILRHDKTFIHRTTGEVDSGRRERIVLYSESDARAVLTSAGLTRVDCYEAWTERKYVGGESMVLTAWREA